MNTKYKKSPFCFRQGGDFCWCAQHGHNLMGEGSKEVD